MFNMNVTEQKIEISLYQQLKDAVLQQALATECDNMREEF